MDYVTYDEGGNLTGGYSQNLHPTHADNHIEVAPEVRANWLNYRANDGRDGVEIVPPFVRPKSREQLKQERAAAVAAIKVTTSTGRTFDGDEDSQARMARAVLIAQATGLTETTWTLADNSIATVTLPELTEALALAGQQQAALWPIPADAV